MKPNMRRVQRLSPRLEEEQLEKQVERRVNPWRQKVGMHWIQNGTGPGQQEGVATRGEASGAKLRAGQSEPRVPRRRLEAGRRRVQASLRRKY